jgi:hypothetical protein
MGTKITIGRIGRAMLFACSLPCACSSVAQSGEKQPSEPMALSHHPQLFLDDFLVAEIRNAGRVVLQPKRHSANPLITQDRPWEARAMSVYGTVLYDEDGEKYRCWYLATESDSGVPDTPEAPGTAEYYQCYAESEDGIVWTKPNVGRRRYGRHQANNIVVPNAHGLCVLRLAEPSRAIDRYLGLGGATLVTSADGIAWRELAPGDNDWRAAVRKNDTSSCVVRWRGQYLAYVRYQGEEHEVHDPESGFRWRGVMRKVGLCTSSDGVHWTSKQPVFASDSRDGYPWTQPYGISVTPYGDVLIGLLPMLHLEPQDGNNGYGTTDVQLVVSRDGRNWHRVANRGVFMPSLGVAAAMDDRRWDMEIYPSTTLLVRKDRVHVYYTGRNVLHGERRLPGKSGLPASFGIGLATLPADRFVAIRPQSDGTVARLETKPLTFSGSELLVNTNVAASDLQIELLDSRGETLEGFAASQSRVSRHDPLRYRVRWKTESEAERSLRDAPPDTPIALRFTWRRGDLFAFQVTAQ